jgi:hypothetical protein
VLTSTPRPSFLSSARFASPSSTSAETIRDIVAGRTISLSARAVTEIGPRYSITESALKRSGVIP